MRVGVVRGVSSRSRSRLPPLVRDAAQSLAVVLVVGLLLFGASGVWPPMVAVESGSMSPHVQKGDLVFVTAPGRWTASADGGDDALLTTREARGSDAGRQFGARGDVIVYSFPERERAGEAPIIHRARFTVERGENWYATANRSYIPPGVDGCAELRSCPAPHDGYVTKGDANDYYDQASTLSAPVVKSEWVRARAAFRVPELGWVRLVLSGQADPEEIAS